MLFRKQRKKKEGKKVGIVFFCKIRTSIGSTAWPPTTVGNLAK